LKTKQSSSPQQLSLFNSPQDESSPSSVRKKVVRKQVQALPVVKAPSPLADQQERRLTVRVPEAAKMLGISRSVAYEAVSRGEIPSVKIGRRVLIPVAALERLLAGENIREKD